MQSEPRNHTDGARSAADKAISSAMNGPNAPANNDTDQQQETFHIVLVDIEKAAHESICCVEKPLADDDMKFVALSYRWGEVHEQVVDTRLGYVASITSCHLDDFYKLCKSILKEPDLQSMEYVWVDAICVDQSNHARRKATIYQMSNIYKRANYILAVPDLHLRYLKDTHINPDAIDNIYKHQTYIYNIIHGNIENLCRADEVWFDNKNIPHYSAARQDVAEYKSKVLDNLEEYNNRPNTVYNGDLRDRSTSILRIADDRNSSPSYALSLNRNTHCLKCASQLCFCKLDTILSPKNECIPYEQRHYLLEAIKSDLWRRQISERRRNIKQAMKYLIALIKDWSSRAWVISEYHIAKNKRPHKLKYWFLQLYLVSSADLAQQGFFELDCDITQVPVQGSWTAIFEKHLDNDIFLLEAICAYDDFHTTMIQQLNEQSFIQMMLRSKTSRNEDRFHAVLPNSNYKHLLESKDVVDSWQIDNIISVKLKLYEFMSTKDKMHLLFYIAMTYSNTFALPSFATIDISWVGNDIDPYFSKKNNHEYNFDLDNNETIQMIRLHVSDDDHEKGPPTPRYKLSLQPNTFFIGNDPLRGIFGKLFDIISREYKTLLASLDVDWDTEEICLVWIPLNVTVKYSSHDKNDLYLYGSFDKNKWLLFTRMPRVFMHYKEFMEWKDVYNNDFTSFDIY